MTRELPPPSKKNPLERSQVPLLPPAARSAPTLGLLIGATQARFALQHCDGCGRFIYPVRDVCPDCLGQRLSFQDAPRGGVVLSETTIDITADPYFRRQPAQRQGLVQADCGVTMIALLHRDSPAEGRVRLSLMTDRAGMPVIFAHPETRGSAHMEDDPDWRELTAQPKYRRVLISDGRSPVAEPLARQLLKAGAQEVFVGVADRWKPAPGVEALAGIEGVTLFDLDLRDERSVTELAADLTGKTDILINTAYHFRPGGLFDAGQVLRAKDSLDICALGLLRLAQAFGPALIGRGGDGTTRNAVAWVNVLSIWAQCGRPASAIFAAAQAAELSLAQSLRGELAQGGVRVMNVFTGALEDEWFENLPPPKTAPAAVAKAVVTALEQGIEESYVGPDAEEFRARMARNPKEVERLMWHG